MGRAALQVQPLPSYDEGAAQTLSDLEGKVNDPRTSKAPSGRRARGPEEEGPAGKRAGAPQEDRGAGPQERGREAGPGPETGLCAPTTETIGPSERHGSAIESPAEATDGPPTLRSRTDQQASVGPVLKA